MIVCIVGVRMDDFWCCGCVVGFLDGVGGGVGYEFCYYGGRLLEVEIGVLSLVLD